MLNSNTLDIGFKGEELACQFLALNGFTVLQRNWRVGHLEIDIIATKENILHIIEVKTRNRTSVHDFAAQKAMGHRKLHKIIDAANLYIDITQSDQFLSIDLLAIDIEAGVPAYNLYEGVQWDEIQL